MSSTAIDTEQVPSHSRVTPLVSVLMVSHNSGPLLLEAIASVLAQQLADGDALELVLVDNASSSAFTPARGKAGMGAAEADALPGDPRLRLVLNPDNRGFAVACNQAAKLARGSWLLLLNPDCRLPDGAVAGLIEQAERQQVGLLGARLLNADGSLQAASYRRDPRPWRALKQALGLARSAEPPDVAADICEVEAISGALMLIRRDDYQGLGGFDAGYRLHVEDLDLCRRARAAGLRVAVANRIEVMHAKGASSKARPIWVEWQKHRGMWRYFKQHDAAATPWLMRPLLWLGLWLHFALRAVVAWWRAR